MAADARSGASALRGPTDRHGWLSVFQHDGARAARRRRVARKRRGSRVDLCVGLRERAGGPRAPARGSVADARGGAGCRARVGERAGGRAAPARSHTGRPRWHRRVSPVDGRRGGQSAERGPPVFVQRRRGARGGPGLVSAHDLKARVEHALGGVRNPRNGGDVLASHMVRDLDIDETGGVSFTFVLTRDDPASLARQARKAVEGVAGVSAVKVTIRDVADMAGAPRRSPVSGTPAPAPPPPPTPDELPGLGKVLAISSGKGGVGKSTVSANLAAALARAGHRVGLMDADIYGPNIPRMFGRNEKPEVQGGKIHPLEAYGVKLMSLGLIVERDAPAIWRGPIIMKIIQQFVRDVAWGQLDYFLVDLPPGTGDAQLSL